MVDEEIVMKEALGGSQYVSACNLVYINQYIADQIDRLPASVFLAKPENLTRL